MTTFLAKIKNVSLDFGSEFNQARFKQFLKDNEGKWIRIELPKPLRTNQQNRYYHLYLQVIERETGNNAEDLHEYFKRTLLPPKFITVLGNEIRIPRSTTELNKIEFGEYLDKICALTDVPLPDRELAGYIIK
jgi:hypothetical protein